MAGLWMREGLWVLGFRGPAAKMQALVRRMEGETDYFTVGWFYVRQDGEWERRFDLEVVPEDEEIVWLCEADEPGRLLDIEEGAQEAMKLDPSLEAAFCDWEDDNEFGRWFFYSPAGIEDIQESEYEILCGDDEDDEDGTSIMVHSKEEIQLYEGVRSWFPLAGNVDESTTVAIM